MDKKVEIELPYNKAKIVTSGDVDLLQIETETARALYENLSEVFGGEREALKQIMQKCKATNAGNPPSDTMDIVIQDIYKTAERAI